LIRNWGKLYKEVFYNLRCLSGIVSVIKSRYRKGIMNWWEMRCAGHSIVICLTGSVPEYAPCLGCFKNDIIKLNL